MIYKFTFSELSTYICLEGELLVIDTDPAAINIQIGDELGF